MIKKFCPKCGKETDKFYDNLCESCFLSKFSVASDIPNIIKIKKCKMCGKFFVKNAAATLEGAVDSFLEDLMKGKEVQSASYRIQGNKLFLTLKTKVNDLEKVEEKIINLIFKSIICTTCAMKKSGYFQAILQVRVPEALRPVILEEIETQIDNFMKYDAKAYISGQERSKQGFDLYIGSKTAARHIAKILKNKYRAEMKISRKLGGSLNGKKVYRDTILILVK